MKNPNLAKLALLLLCCTCTLTLALEADQQNDQPLQAFPDIKNDPLSTASESGGRPSSSSAQDGARGSTSSSSSSSTTNYSQPHIVMIVVDDMGWNDVDWRDGKLHTPVMTRLASHGLVLNQSYVQPVCSPSRAAFLSGFYPYHLGLQHDSLRATQKAYLPANVTTLPEHLQKLGYRTHMAGKWHLGFCNWKYTPTYRGFHSFVGFYNAIQDYYSHIGHHQGYDFRKNEDVYYEAKGTYSAFIFTQYIEKVIGEHDVSKPLFVYLPYQSVHGPLQVPQVYIDKFCSHIRDKNRRLKCGMLAVLDEGVGNITEALKNRGLFNDTVLLVTTDNGGPVHEGANNWPLRGSKTTLWEGGTRAMAFLHAPRFLETFRGGVYDGVIHAVDWLPTLVEAAGGRAADGLDGVSQWQSLLQGKVPSARTEFLYNMDELKNNSALRQGRFKLFQGHPGHPDSWYPPPKLQEEKAIWDTLPHGSSSADYLEESSTDDLEEAGRYFEERISERFSYGRASSRLADYILGLRSRGLNNSYPFFQRALNFRHKMSGNAVVSMKSPEGNDRADKTPEYQLYDLEADPTERNDVKDKYRDVFKSMRARLEEYRKSLVPANFPPHDPDALPSKFHGVWSPGWC